MTTIQETAEANYRVILKRFIRVSGFSCKNEDTTHDLETMVIAIGRNNPKVIANFVTRLFGQSAESWVKGNNSGDSAENEKQEKICEEYRGRAERLVKLFGPVAFTYPGLFPVFHYKGLDYHSAEGLFWDISKE